MGRPRKFHLAIPVLTLTRRDSRRFRGIIYDKK